MKNGILLFIIAVVVLLVFLPGYSKMQDMKQKNIEYDQKITDLKEEIVELKEEKRRLIEDPVYLEGVAREKMGLVKEGEVIYRITTEERDSE